MTPFDLALKYYGIKEIAGDEHNPIILEMFKELGHGWVHDDETAWCAAFIGWACKKAGYEYSRSLSARSWLDIGEPTKAPQIGDICVLWRISKDSVYGHVGFYITERYGYIYMLGGNQSNQVNISAYPKSRLLGYRVLKCNSPNLK